MEKGKWEDGEEEVWQEVWQEMDVISSCAAHQTDAVRAAQAPAVASVRIKKLFPSTLWSRSRTRDTVVSSNWTGNFFSTYGNEMFQAWPALLSLN